LFVKFDLSGLDFRVAMLDTRGYNGMRSRVIDEQVPDRFNFNLLAFLCCHVGHSSVQWHLKSRYRRAGARQI